MKKQMYNVRLFKNENGTFEFDTVCFMHRCAKHNKNYEWVDASETDRKNLKQQLYSD